jgi:hypothetical protein
VQPCLLLPSPLIEGLLWSCRGVRPALAPATFTPTEGALRCRHDRCRHGALWCGMVLFIGVVWRGLHGLAGAFPDEHPPPP